MSIIPRAARGVNPVCPSVALSPQPAAMSPRPSALLPVMGTINSETFFKPELDFGRRIKGEGGTVNPLIKWRRSHNLDRKHAAIFLDCNYNCLDNAEAGRVDRIPPRLLRALTAVGVDADEMQREYREWRADVASQIRAKIA